MELFASEDPEKVDELDYWLELPTSKVDKVKKNYQSSIQRKEAYLDLYVHQHPCPSWQCVCVEQQADFVEKTYVNGTESVALLS